MKEAQKIRQEILSGFRVGPELQSKRANNIDARISIADELDTLL
jgi:hypothetical protein